MGVIGRFWEISEIITLRLGKNIYLVFSLLKEFWVYSLISGSFGFRVQLKFSPCYFFGSKVPS